MARMIPKTIHSSVVSGAERRLFRVIADTPNTDGWICLHSLGLSRHDLKRRGEIDFALLTQHGVFVLEVKGGRIRRQDGVWEFMDRYGNTTRKAEGPFDQAASAMFALEKDVRKRFRNETMSDVMFGYGVLMPDIEFESVGSESDPALVYDIRDRKHSFIRYMNRLAEFTRGRQTRPRRGLRRDDMERLADFLRNDFDLVPSLGTVVEDTNRQLMDLTKEQYAVLDAMDSLQRVVVEGAAGTGKTILGLEAARRAARTGQSVLVLCFNRLLAVKLRRQLEGEEYSGRLAVRTLHSQFQKLIDESSLAKEFADVAASESGPKLFDQLYPEYANLAAFEGMTAPYDVLVVDEAQDVVTDANLGVMDELIRGGMSDGSWRFFLDPNTQASVYGRMDEDSLDRLRRKGVVHVLTLNCRNTRPIELHTAVLSAQIRRCYARVDGPPVQFHSYANEADCLSKLVAVLNDLNKESIAPGSLSVLFPRQPTEEFVTTLTAYGVIPLSESDVSALGTRDLEFVTWSVVSGFKGLENDVVILAGVDDLDPTWWKAVTYVGMSRARMRLYVLMHEQCEAARSERLERELGMRLGEEVGDS